MTISSMRSAVECSTIYNLYICLWKCHVKLESSLINSVSVFSDFFWRNMDTWKRIPRMCTCELKKGSDLQGFHSIPIQGNPTFLNVMWVSVMNDISRRNKWIWQNFSRAYNIARVSWTSSNFGDNWFIGFTREKLIEGSSKGIVQAAFVKAHRNCSWFNVSFSSIHLENHENNPGYRQGIQHDPSIHHFSNILPHTWPWLTFHKVT